MNKHGRPNPTLSRGPMVPVAIVLSLPKGAHQPAEIDAVSREEGHFRDSDRGGDPMRRRGFTSIELFVVIALLAVPVPRPRSRKTTRPDRISMRRPSRSGRTG